MANAISKDVQRLDWYDNAIDWETRPAETTPEGFLVARVPVTSIGVFQYRNDDGTTRRELRLPEEVFAPESMDSLKCKPLTLNHPDVKIVTPENIEGLQVGSVGSDVTGDSYRVYVTLSATKQDAISAIRAGTNRGLSCGYNCDIEWTSGTWLGMPYDCIQRNIRYNHVALVPAGRAGDDAQIRMDSAGVPCGIPQNFNEKENNMALQTIHLDGADLFAADAYHFLSPARKVDIPLVRDVAAVPGPKKTIHKGFLVIFRIKIAHHGLVPVHTNFPVNHPDFHIVGNRLAD